jgi:polyisoprenyl-phosphate glycosyltransferase
MPAEKVVIITPCFNENRTVIAFLRSLEEILGSLPYSFEVVVVDDSSSDNTLAMLGEFRFNYDNCQLTILGLAFNVGHQSAIYQGLLYAKDLDSNKFIVMDSDGEDDPRAIQELVSMKDYNIVNVARGRRKESLSFQASYYIYRYIFKFIAGKVLNFGNYCMIDKRVLLTCCSTSFIHFAAHLSKQKVKSTNIVYNRLKRIDGKSKMNLTSLIHHAFKSFVEYAEQLLMVFLRLFLFIILAFVVLAGVVIYKKYFAHVAILGWASTITLSLFNTAIVCLGFFIMGILLLNMIAKRNETKKPIYKILHGGD